MFDNVNYDLIIVITIVTIVNTEDDTDLVKDAGRISLTFVYLHTTKWFK